MGTWGTGISSNDTYSDVYGDFMDLYNEGVALREITAKLISQNKETIDIEEDAPNFWFALANAQWECCALDNVVLSKVENLIQTGEDLHIWKDLGGSTADIKAREKVLTKFLTKLQSPKDKPKKRTKKKLYNSIFKKGDCLIYIMNNGNYGGAFVLTDEENTQVGTNYIAITTINKPQKPTLYDFNKAEVYVRHENTYILKNAQLVREWRDRPQIGGFGASQYKEDNMIEVVGRLPINKDYQIENQSGYGWAVLKSTVPFDEEYIKINGAPKFRVKLSEWTAKRSWLQKLFGK